MKKTTVLRKALQKTDSDFTNDYVTYSDGRENGLVSVKFVGYNPSLTSLFVRNLSSELKKHNKQLSHINQTVLNSDYKVDGDVFDYRHYSRWALNETVTRFFVGDLPEKSK